MERSHMSNSAHYDKQTFIHFQKKEDDLLVFDKYLVVNLKIKTAQTPPITFDCRIKPQYPAFMEIDKVFKTWIDNKDMRIIPGRWQ
jgi:hypothetical protein